MTQETSITSYFEIEPELGQRQEEVFLVLKDLGEATNTMIAKRMNLPINSITPRVFELRQKHLVTESYRDICPITKRRAIFWKAHAEEK